MALHINIEDRYRLAAKRERQMHYVWAATAAAVIGVGAAAAGTAISMDASKKAAGAQAAAGKKLRREQAEATASLEQKQGKVKRQISKIKEVPVEQFNLGSSIPQAIGAAGQITDYNLAQRRKITPEAEQIDRLLGQKFLDVFGGKGITDQQVSEILRRGAEVGAFNIATAGKSAIPGLGQTGQFDYLRNIGATQEAQFMAYAPMFQNWQEASRMFVQQALPVAQFAESAFQGRVGLQQQNQQFQLNKLQTIADMNNAMFGAQTSLAQTGYKTREAQAAADLNVGMQTAQGVQNIGSAVSQVGTAYAGGVQQMRQNEMDQQYLDMLKGVYGGTQNV